MSLDGGRLLLAGDIGGSKTILALYSIAEGLRTSLYEKQYINSQCNSFDTILKHFFRDSGYVAENACFAAAGPVFDGVVKLTNLPWSISENALQESYGFKGVKLVNDAEAALISVPLQNRYDLHALRPGAPRDVGAKVLIAIGTGLGVAFQVWDGSRHVTVVSEGGHADFAPQNAIELALWNYCMEEFGHVSYERVCSGAGIQKIYQFLSSSGRIEEPVWLRDELSKHPEPVPVIIKHAIQKDSEICAQTLKIFISILGAFSGNVALEVVASGGVYLAGGIPSKIIPLLQSGDFINAFNHKGRMSDIMAHIPVHIVLNPKAALQGAAQLGFSLYTDSKQ